MGLRAVRGDGPLTPVSVAALALESNAVAQRLALPLTGYLSL